MGRRRKAVTIKDVAKAAGVSVSTVSRVLNGKGDVSAETAEKVRRVIEKLDYTSSLAARSMRSRRTGIIGVVAPDVANPFIVQVMRGLNDAVSELGYELIVCTSGRFNQNPTAERERYYVSLLRDIADGIIVITPASSSFPNNPVPIVVVDPNSGNMDCPAVMAANKEGALKVMDYLIGLGHRRIGFIGGRPELLSAVLRLEGYMEGLRKAGIPVEEDLIQIGDYSMQMGYELARRLLSLPEPPTAIFAANDQSAIGVLRAAHEMGVRVPEELSVVGFDNIPESAYTTPALTTVDQFITRMGETAVRMLARLIAGEPLESPIYQISTELVVRDSCSEPAPV